MVTDKDPEAPLVASPITMDMPPALPLPLAPLRITSAPVLPLVTSAVTAYKLPEDNGLPAEPVARPVEMDMEPPTLMPSPADMTTLPPVLDAPVAAPEENNKLPPAALAPDVLPAVMVKGLLEPVVLLPATMLMAPPDPAPLPERI